MSHEGVRFISAEEAAMHREREARQLSGDAVRPAKIRVDKTGGPGVPIDWRAGHQSHWSFRWLRDACPCATCLEERGGQGRAAGEPKSRPATLLPLYQAPIRPDDVEAIGRYALKFKWNDGHESGIYSWDYLRNVCDAETATQPAAPA